MTGATPPEFEMPTYVIQHRIDTLLDLWEPFDFKGFRFVAWSIDYTAGRVDGWIAEKHIEADTVEGAFHNFSEDLHLFVDRIAFIGQCHTAAELETFIITKPGDNRFFWRYAQKREPVPLSFQSEDVSFLTALEDYEETGDVFRYLKEATNATSYYTQLVMLVSALEAMAGVTDEKGRRSVDREYIAKEILKDEELCKSLFQYGEGLRNQILHGGFVDYDMHGGTDYNAIVRDAIIGYFNDRHGLNISTDAKSRPRTHAGGYEFWAHWCEWEGEQVSLQLLNEGFRTNKGSEYFKPIVRPDDF